MAPYRRTTRSIRKVTTAPLDRAWAAMRIAQSQGGSFTIPDVLAASEAQPESFARYLKALERTGFVVKIANHASRLHKPAVFRLVRNSGPYRPHMQTDGVVYDRNTATEYVPSKETPDDR